MKLCPSLDGKERFILCRSAERAAKEKAIYDRFEKRVETGLNKLADSCRKRKQKLGAIERRVGRLLEGNSHAAGLFRMEVKERSDHSAEVALGKMEEWRAWAEMSEGCYLLRSNITDWDAEQLWRVYINSLKPKPPSASRRVT